VERLNKLNLGDLATTVDVFDIGIRHEVGDIVTLTHPVGLVAKAMRVTDVEMTSMGRWRLAVTEHDPAAYSDAVVSGPSVADTPRVLPPGDASNVTSLAGSAGNGRVTWSWAPNPDADYEATELRDSDANWGAASPAPVFRGKANTGQQLVFAAGETTIYARHFGRSGNQSTATASQTIEVTAADLGLPAVVVEFRDDDGVFYTNAG
jgi:hypothetical protein